MSRAALVIALAFAAGTLSAAGQEPKLTEVVDRVAAYVNSYGAQLASVVAEEAYEQTLEQPAPAAAPRGTTRNTNPEAHGPADRTFSSNSRVANKRVLRSDYALTRVTERVGWIGYRDTFEVDGRVVRDREERLQRLLASGDIGQAARIATQNARFNLGEALLTRTVNIPTLALELLHPSRRERFSTRRNGTETVNGQAGWVVEFRERGSPTIIRMPNGRDQPSRILAVVDPITGTVLKTTLSWEKVTGSIVVTYGLVPRMPVLVPLTMSERYTTRGGVKIGGEAVYSNYRQFQTGGRIVTP